VGKTLFAQVKVRGVENTGPHHRPTWWRFRCSNLGLRRPVSGHGVLAIDVEEVFARLETCLAANQDKLVYLGQLKQIGSLKRELQSLALASTIIGNLTTNSDPWLVPRLSAMT
jgi:hypothetical protein